MAGLREARSYGIQVRVITNSMGATDEPQASMALRALPGADAADGRGAVRAELDADPSGRVVSRRAFGSSRRAQLHAKLAIIDRRTVLLGSMNPRPALGPPPTPSW